MTRDSVAALALARLPGVRRRRLRVLVERLAGESIGNAAAFATWIESRAAGAALPVPSPDACDAAWREAVALAEASARRGWQVWTIGGAGYPERLQRLADPPAILFVHGPARWPDAPAIAIVGTREPTRWGESTAGACAAAASRAGAVVVSGLAWGIDTAAHRAVVDGGGRTWATLPGALDVVFPTSNRGLAARIVERGGALVSEYPPGTRPRPTFFVARDRLQAALADVVLVVETGRTGGTHHTIRFARELHVPVWVTLPDEFRSPANADVNVPVPQQGTFDLWRSGCPVVSAADVTAWALSRRAGRPPDVERPLPPAQGRLFDE